MSRYPMQCFRKQQFAFAVIGCKSVCSMLVNLVVWNIRPKTNNFNPLNLPFRQRTNKHQSFGGAITVGAHRLNFNRAQLFEKTCVVLFARSTAKMPSRKLSDLCLLSIFLILCRKIANLLEKPILMHDPINLSCRNIRGEA